MRNSFHRGQTLLELLTALFVLGLALVGGLGLTSSNFKLEGIGTSRLVATNLAREGIELARAIRDSNWLAGNEFDAGLIDVKHCAAIAPDMTGVQVDHFSFQECADVFDAAYQLYRSADGRFANSATFGDPSQLYRIIRLDPICLVGGTESVQSDAQCDPGTEIGIAVSSKVGWYYAGQKMNLSLNEHLYDWQ